jgi:hypothetical protein
LADGFNIDYTIGGQKFQLSCHFVYSGLCLCLTDCRQVKKALICPGIPGFIWDPTSFCKYVEVWLSSVQNDGKTFVESKERGDGYISKEMRYGLVAIGMQCDIYIEIILRVHLLWIKVSNRGTQSSAFNNFVIRILQTT